MTQRGFYQYGGPDGTVRTVRDVKFESTGIKDEYGKVIWRKIKRDGTPSNSFAEQFEPNMPWAFGKWFMKRDSAWVLQKWPQLKVETDMSKTMSDEEYIKYLKDSYKPI